MAVPVTARLAIDVNLPANAEPTRSLLYHFHAVNSRGPAPSVRCTVCKTWGKVNPKLRTTPFVCGACRG